MVSDKQAVLWWTVYSGTVYGAQFYGGTDSNKVVC